MERRHGYARDDQWGLCAVMMDDSGGVGLRLIKRECPQCASSQSSPRYSKGGYNVVTCDACGFTYLPVAADISHYVQGAGAWENSRVSNIQQRQSGMPLQMRLSLATRFRTKFRKRNPVQYIERYFEANGDSTLNVLDIGCGSGGHMMTLPPRFVPYGIELSRDLAATAQALFSQRGGSVVHAATVEGLSQFTQQSMDAIVMRSYLEHESDPLGVLKECAVLLKPKGVIVVKVPNYGSLNRRVMGIRWCGFRFPEHVNYFTPASLADMASLAGLKASYRLLDRLPTSDNMWVTLTHHATVALTEAA